MTTLLRLSTPHQEGELRVSKWIKLQVLLSYQEMQNCFETLKNFSLFVTSEPTSLEEAEISQKTFLEKYREYQETLASGHLGDMKNFRKFFSCVMTASSEVLYAMPVGNRFLIKAIQPVIQFQHHQFFVSSLDGSFHTMVLGKESIHWGLQISYPQLYQDPKTHHVEKVGKNPAFPNSSLFLTLVRFIRENTLPTSFEKNGQKTTVPIRLGKECLPWINKHPQLKEKGLVVVSKFLAGSHEAAP